MKPIGPRYAWGMIAPANMWSDNPPQRIFPTGEGQWPGAFEMRSWAASGEDIAASVLMFSSEEQAHSFFEQAASSHCHRSAKTRPTASPPGARNLVWVNPDGPTQEDVFLLRGTRVYRIADVRPGARGSSATEQQRGLAIVNRLACSLPAGGCTPSAAVHAQRSSRSGS